MDRKKKNIRYTSAGILALFIIAIAIKWALDSPYRKNVPSLPDMQSISVPVKQQIAGASRKAKLNPSADNLGKLGMVYHSSANYDRAAQCYKLAVKRNKSKWIWNYYNGYLHKEMGESAAAIESFSAVLKENKKAYHAWYYIGEGYQNLNLNDKAVTAFSKISNLQSGKFSSTGSMRNDYFPLRTFAQFQLSQVYLSNTQYDKAESTLNTIIENHRSFGPAYRLLGSVYSAMGEESQSKDYIARAGDLAEYKPPVDTLIDKIALMSRSELYLLKQIDEAERALYPEYALRLIEHAMQYIPENKYLLSKAVNLNLRLNSGNKILPYLNRLIHDFKDDFNELKLTANLLFDKGFIAQSMFFYQQALTIKPEDSEAQASLFLALLKVNKKQTAMDLIAGILKKYPDNPKVLANAVYLMVMAGNREMAVSYMAMLKRLSPTGPKTYQLSGIIAEQDGKLKEAMTMYELAFKGNPEDLVSINSLSNLLSQQKMWASCINLLRRALVFHPNEPYLLEKLGTILVTCPDTTLRDYDQGRIYSERAFIHKASPTETMLSAGKSLAEAYAGLGDKKNAVTYLTTIFELAQSQQVPKEFLIEIQEKLKQYAQ